MLIFCQLLYLPLNIVSNFLPLPISDSVTTSKVRIPSNLVGKLIGERGKTVTEISRDSKTQITIPKADDAEDDAAAVVVSITGKKADIKTAQYLMQRVLKGP